MKRLLPFLKGYYLECILGPLFKLFEASLELLVPLVIVSLIDTAIPSGSLAPVLRSSALLAALGLIGFLCSAVAQFFAAKASAQFAGRIRRALFSHIQDFSYAQLDTLGVSTLLTRMTSDMNQLQQGVNLGLRLLLRSPFVVFGAAVMAFTIDVQAAMVFAVAIPALAVVVFGIILGCVPLYRAVQQKLDGLLGLTRENLTGVRVIRAFGREEAEDREFRSRGQQLRSAQERVNRISSLLGPITLVLINLAIAWLVWRGALRVESGTLTQGQVIALYNYMSQILVELIKLANLIITLTKAAACAGRVADMLELPAGQSVEPDLPQRESRYAMEFRDVSFRYPSGGEDALQHLNLFVLPGQTVGVIGGTGSGKTTFANLIPRFYDPSEGDIYLNGRNLRALQPEEIRQQIGVVPQKALLFAGTIRSNLLWGAPRADDAALWEALRIAQAEEIVKGKSGGLDAEVEQAGRNFSGGQRQRLTIARALVGKPPILILDDSSSALDFATDAALRKALRSLSWNPTVFLISQRVSSIRHADVIFVLDDGAVAGIGTHSELMEHCGVYREIAESQNRKEEQA